MVSVGLIFVVGLGFAFAFESADPGFLGSGVLDYLVLRCLLTLCGCGAGLLKDSKSSVWLIFSSMLAHCWFMFGSLLVHV